MDSQIRARRRPVVGINEKAPRIGAKVNARIAVAAITALARDPDSSPHPLRVCRNSASCPLFRFHRNGGGGWDFSTNLSRLAEP
jgi:hypothetical protein